MALNFNRAAKKVMSGSFLRTVGLAIAGFAAASFVTDFARSNVIDLDVDGADAVYAAAASVLTLALLPSGVGTPAAIGMMVAGGQTALNDFGVNVV